jgi:hypothetical protein
MFKNKEWMRKWGFDNIRDKIEYFKDKEYGVVWSRHIHLEPV